jgi:hypothetical protein
MNWEDERYVRLYTRDTGDWCALSWDGQALLMQLLRKADRSGVIQLGRRGRTALPNMLFHGAQADRIDVALTELLDDGCVELHGTNLVIPNFTVAQEAKQSDKLRQQESRARRLAQARSDLVSKPTNVSHAVTDGHESSQPVTPSVPSVLNQPSRAEFAGDASHPPPSPRVVAPDLRHEAGERMTPPARMPLRDEELDTAKQAHVEADTAASPQDVDKREAPPLRTRTSSQTQVALLPDEPKRQAPARQTRASKPASLISAAWDAFASAHERRHGVAPVWCGKMAGIFKRIVGEVGAEAPAIAAYYLTHNGAFYVSCGHSAPILERDIQKLRREMLTGSQVNAAAARQTEQRAAASDSWEARIREREREEQERVIDVDCKPE